MHRFARALIAFLTLALCLPVSAQAPAPLWPDTDWPRAAPEALGMDSRALAALVDYGAHAQMDSLVVTRHGRIVAEAYYAPFRSGMKHRINSATKGVIGVLTGIAVGKGLLGGTGTSVLELLPQRTAGNVDARKQAMTLQSLLDMTSGIDWTEPLTAATPDTLIAMQRTGDWQQFILDQPMALPPGASFNYNSGNSHLVSAIIAAAAGMPTEDFAARELFTPLGITDWRWRKDPQGLAIGGFGLYLRTPDMARIGYLYLQGGLWNGVQLVPRAWVDRVFKASVPMAPMAGWRYADFWWTVPARRAIMAVGYNRQVIMVLPDLGIVAAMTGRRIYPIENVIDHLTRAARPQLPLPPDPDAHALLQARIRDAASDKPSAAARAAPPLAQEISGRSWRLEANDWGWTEFTLHLGDAPFYEVVSNARGAVRKASRPLGMDGRFAIFEAGGEVVASQAGWTGERTLELVVRLPEEGSTLHFELRFEGDALEIVRTNDFGVKRTVRGERQSAPQ